MPICTVTGIWSYPLSGCHLEQILPGTSPPLTLPRTKETSAQRSPLSHGKSFQTSQKIFWLIKRIFRIFKYSKNIQGWFHLRVFHRIRFTAPSKDQFTHDPFLDYSWYIYHTPNTSLLPKMFTWKMSCKCLSAVHPIILTYNICFYFMKVYLFVSLTCIPYMLITTFGKTFFFSEAN